MKAVTVILILIFIGLIHPFPGWGDPLAGPMEIKNQFPLFLHLNRPVLESAAVQDSFSIQCSYSSIFFVRDNPRWAVYLDMEWLEFNLKYQKTLFSFLEISLELPILSFNSGFMDNGLDWYHTTFGFRDYGRRTRPANQFLYRVKKDDDPVIEGEDGKVGFGDLKISAKKVLMKMDDQPFLSLKAAVELPTGDPETGYGNGSLDLGLLVQVEKKLTRYLQATGNGGLVIPGNLRAHKTVELKNYWFGGIGLEAKPWKRLSVLGQISAQTSPFPETGFDFLDNPALVLTLGGRYYLDRNHFELSLTEDLNTSGAPDFTVNFSFKHAF
ncbi:MAG: DUF3187 family protein [Deltaproteobacteria bacterium]|nr:DUF3187 family protein [Deltaproteobacteria bacterium]